VVRMYIKKSNYFTNEIENYYPLLAKSIYAKVLDLISLAHNFDLIDSTYVVGVITITVITRRRVTLV